MLLSLRVVTAAVIALLVVFDIAMAGLPLWVGAVYISAGIVALIVYRRDKHAAQTSIWRISEANLHLVDLLFGIIGGLVAQQVLRHKTRNPSFAAVTWLISALHIGVLVAVGTGLIDMAQLVKLGG